MTDMKGTAMQRLCRRWGLLILIGCCASCSAEAAPKAAGTGAPEAAAPAAYRGMSDASAAVALDPQTFIVADDEQNVLRVYRRDRPDEPIALVDWNRHLGIDPASDDHPEADIEGAAQLEGRIYWITSHGRNKDGKWRANRHRFFAMTVRAEGQRVTAEPFGRCCDTLIERLAADPRYQRLGLLEALQPGQKEIERLAPKDEGLNVEALATAPGEGLLIGFRNPRPDGRALIAPLLNPEEVLVKGADPRFGEPILLGLHARHKGHAVALGLRSMAYVPQAAAYLLVAGAQDEERVFALYRWTGDAASPPQLLTEATAAVERIGDFSPEAAIVYPASGKVQLLSDDGALPVKVASPAECLPGEYRDGACEQKALRDDARKRFKSVDITLR